MACIVFPGEPRNGGAYPPLARRLGERHSIHYVTDEPPADAPEWLIPVSPDEIAGAPGRWSLALVFHPYWLGSATALRPDRLVLALPGDSFEGEEPVWRKRFVQAIAVADLIAVASESRYLELTFKKRSTWLLQDDGLGDAESGRLFARAATGEESEAAVVAQRRSLRDRYAEIRDKAGPHETISFLLSVYEYLLGMPDAAAHLREAFGHAVALRRPDCLITHYRFLSAILAAEDRLEEALDAYGATAASPQDKTHYEAMCLLAEQGRPALAKALLLRLNDDVVGALEALETAPDPSPEASRMRAGLLLDAGRLPEAVAVANGGRSRVEDLLLAGAVKKLEGDRFGAVRLYLEAAERERDAIAAIVELKEEDEALLRLRRWLRGNGGDEDGAPNTAGSQSAEQQADGDAASP